MPVQAARARPQRAGLAWFEATIMTPLRIGAYQLAPAEAGLIRALLKLSSQGAQGVRWSFVTEAPYDVLIVDAASTEAGAPACAAMVGAILKLADSNDGSAPDTLARPVHAQHLEAWLLRISTAAPRTIGAAAAAACAPAQAAREDSAAAPASLFSACAPERFKLHRWPPHALVMHDPQRLRLSTLLSRRALSIGELSRMSQQAEEQCRQFVDVLRSANLLLVQDTPALACEHPAPVNPSSHARSHLVHSIRRRLGIALQASTS